MAKAFIPARRRRVDAYLYRHDRWDDFLQRNGLLHHSCHGEHAACAWHHRHSNSRRGGAGNLAFLLFALGIIGTGLLAIPVLAGSGAYAVAELFGWPSTLETKFPEAIGFYAIIFAATVIGFAMGFLPINPIWLLVWTAVINGIVAAPIMAMMTLIVSNRSAMGRFRARLVACLGGLGGNSSDGHHCRCIAMVTVAVGSGVIRLPTFFRAVGLAAVYMKSRLAVHLIRIAGAWPIAGRFGRCWRSTRLCSWSRSGLA
jgi:Mn2+/Fe2+ NRAMP family transporter